MPRLFLSRDGVTEPRLSRSGCFATRMIQLEILTLIDACRNHVMLTLNAGAKYPRFQ